MKQLFASLMFVGFLGSNVAYAITPTVEWIEELTTSDDDFGQSVSTDGMGNVYVVGSTRGDLAGTNAGDWDVFVSKYNKAGTLLWTEQLGTSDWDAGYGVSADGLGNVYITGSTLEALSGTNAGLRDAFISKFDDSGTLLWTEQLGTSSRDISHSVSADGLGNVYITGYTLGDLGGTNAGLWDAYVSKYDDAGNLIWTEQLGTDWYDLSNAVSADGLGNVYIAGYTTGSLGGPNAGGDGEDEYDAFLSKFDASGTLLWTEQLGTSREEFVSGVSVDGLGNIYISGYSEGDLTGNGAGGDYDSFLAKYDESGNLMWIEQISIPQYNEYHSVSADSLGNVYVTGITYAESGSGDAVVTKYDAAGSVFWTELLEGRSETYGNGVSADNLGNVYVTGSVSGGFDFDNPGFNAAYVAKLSDEEAIPEPSGLSLIMFGAFFISCRVRRSNR